MVTAWWRVDAGHEPVERRRVGGVAGGGRHRDRDAGERRVRREVEVAAEDAAHVGPGDRVGQAVLVDQLDDLGGRQHRHRDRRVVQREQGAVRGRRREHVGQPAQLVVGEVAVVVAGHAACRGRRSAARRRRAPGPAGRRRRRRTARAAYGARSSWLPITQTTSAPNRSAAGSTSSRSRAYAAGSAMSARSPVNTSACGRGRAGSSRSRASRSPASGSTAPYWRAPSASRWGSLKWATTWPGGGVLTELHAVTVVGVSTRAR